MEEGRGDGEGPLMEVFATVLIHVTLTAYGTLGANGGLAVCASSVEPACMPSASTGGKRGWARALGFGRTPAVSTLHEVQALAREAFERSWRRSDEEAGGWEDVEGIHARSRLGSILACRCSR